MVKTQRSKHVCGSSFVNASLAFFVCRTKLVSFDFTSGERLCKFDAHTGEAGCLAAFADGVRSDENYLFFRLL